MSNILLYEEQWASVLHLLVSFSCEERVSSQWWLFMSVSV